MTSVQGSWIPESPGPNGEGLDNPDPRELVTSALRALEGDDPLGREAALCWLLNHVSNYRTYQVDGVTADLRADLPIRLAAAWEEKNAAFEGFDIAALRVASTLVGDSKQPVVHAWTLARWLRGLLELSPFTGSDPEVLAARLSALRIGEVFSAPPDVLDPRTITRLGDHAFVSAVAVHYASWSPVWPTPGPIAQRLLNLTREAPPPSRDLTDELNWRARLRAGNLSTAARRLCTDLKLNWITEARQVTECLDALAPWMAEAIFRERDNLTDEARLALATRWREGKGMPRAAVLLAASAGDCLDSADHAELLQLAMQAELEWRPWLLGAIGEMSAVDTHLVLNELLPMVEAGDDRTRVEAALIAARISAGLVPDDALKRRLGQLVSAPIFRHGKASQALRRYGF